MRTQPEPGTRVRCEDRPGMVVAQGDRKALAHREQLGGLADEHHAYIQWDDGLNGKGRRCLVLNAVLQPL